MISPTLSGNPGGNVFGQLFRVYVFRIGREDDAGEGVMAAVGFGPDFPGPLGETPHVIEPGQLIQQALVPDPVDLELGTDEGLELEQESFPVERLSQEFPGSGAIGFQPLGPPGGARGGNDDRNGAAEAGIVPQRAADLDAVHIRHLGVQDDHIRLGGARPIESLLPGIGAKHREPIRGKDTLERTGRPFLVVRDENQRRTGGLIAIVHNSRCVSRDHQ
jgi:hypothetical protein